MVIKHRLKINVSLWDKHLTKLKMLHLVQLGKKSQEAVSKKPRTDAVPSKNSNEILRSLWDNLNKMII